MQMYIKAHFFFVKGKFPPCEADSKKLKRQMLSFENLVKNYTVYPETIF